MTAPYEALNRLCLNNWHYIDRKILKFHKEMNFFTGHSGSGKSTVIDALQILLYANTDGRGFFNKAATDESELYPDGISAGNGQCGRQQFLYISEK